MKKNKLGLYLHLPFCEKKCNYCDFLSFATTEEVRGQYVKNLVKEMILWKERVSADFLVDTVFIGGGTPSVLSVPLMNQIFESLHHCFNLSGLQEFTIECNPNSLSKEKLSCYIGGGVNRISIGMQSAQDKELKALGRLHNREQFYRAYMQTRELGVENINIDLMSAIPEQTIDSYLDTLEYVMALQPEHISSYSLIVEEGTPFYELYGEHPPVDEDTDREMYELTKQIFSDHGYERYEISNYAHKGKECQHNIKYWRRTPYLGIGLGAASMMDGERRSNVRSLKKYEELTNAGYLPVEEIEVLTKEDKMAEFMFLGLRCMKGVSEKEFETEFGVSMIEQYGEILLRFQEKDFMQKKEEYWSLTTKGIDVSNRIFAEFI